SPSAYCGFTIRKGCAILCIFTSLFNTNATNTYLRRANNKKYKPGTTLCGWVQRTREMGGITFVDLRDRYGITQLVFDANINKELGEKARTLGREFVIRATGKVVERSNKNPKIPTGEIEIIVASFELLNASKTP